MSSVSPSVVPNYFPTLRVIEYNITGLDASRMSGSPVATRLDSSEPLLENPSTRAYFSRLTTYLTSATDSLPFSKKHNKKHSRKGRPKKPRKPSFTHPLPPSKSAPPGPAYSPQSLSWLSYTQYFANLTRINGDFSSTDPSNDDSIDEERWKEGKYHGRKPRHDKNGKHPASFKYEIEYSTLNDSVFHLTDLTVRSWLDLAAQIGEYREKWDLEVRPAEKEKKKKNDNNNKTRDKKERKREKRRYRRKIQELWYTFIRRAYVDSKSEEEIRDDF